MKFGFRTFAASAMLAAALPATAATLDFEVGSGVEVACTIPGCAYFNAPYQGFTFTNYNNTGVNPPAGWYWAEDASGNLSTSYSGDDANPDETTLQISSAVDFTFNSLDFASLNDGDSFVFKFYNRAGAVIATIDGTASLADQYYSLAPAGGIAGVASMTVTGWLSNNLTLDNIDYSIGGNDVPEPSTYALLGLGLLGIAASRRKRA